MHGADAEVWVGPWSHHGGPQCARTMLCTDRPRLFTPDGRFVQLAPRFEDPQMFGLSDAPVEHTQVCSCRRDLSFGRQIRGEQQPGDAPASGWRSGRPPCRDRTADTRRSAPRQRPRYGRGGWQSEHHFFSPRPEPGSAARSGSRSPSPATRPPEPSGAPPAAVHCTGRGPARIRSWRKIARPSTGTHHAEPAGVDTNRARGHCP